MIITQLYLLASRNMDNSAGRRLSKKEELLAQGAVPGFGGVPEEKPAFSGVWPTDLSPAAQACSIHVDHHSCSFVGFGPSAMSRLVVFTTRE